LSFRSQRVTPDATIVVPLAQQLFDLTRNATADSVDDRTWIDLEFERLFSSVDSTLTSSGSQCLYHKLRIYRDDPGELENDYGAPPARTLARKEIINFSHRPLFTAGSRRFFGYVLVVDT
jgi:hypothetical protein